VISLISGLMVLEIELAILVAISSGRGSAC